MKYKVSIFHHKDQAMFENKGPCHCVCLYWELFVVSLRKYSGYEF